MSSQDPEIGLFASRVSIQLLEYMSWKQDTQHRTRCFSNKLEPKVILRLATLCADREGFEGNTARSKNNDYNITSIARPVMVSTVVSNLNKDFILFINLFKVD